jgi:hypothetical protein
MQNMLRSRAAMFLALHGKQKSLERMVNWHFFE